MKLKFEISEIFLCLFFFLGGGRGRGGEMSILKKGPQKLEIAVFHSRGFIRCRVSCKRKLTHAHIGGYCIGYINLDA